MNQQTVDFSSANTQHKDIDTLFTSGMYTCEMVILDAWMSWQYIEDLTVSLEKYMPECEILDCERVRVAYVTSASEVDNVNSLF